MHACLASYVTTVVSARTVYSALQEREDTENVGEKYAYTTEK